MSSFLRQLSSKEGWKSNSSKRWVSGNGGTHFDWEAQNGPHMGMYGGGGGVDYNQNGYNNGYGSTYEGMMMMSSKKRVMVVVDESSRCKHAMMWALSHVTNKGDWLTLLHVVSPSFHSSSSSCVSTLATSLASLCKACKPEVEVEAIVIEGPKLGTVLNQVKKLEASVLVLGQKKPSPIMTCLSNTEGFVNECINNAECLTIGVRKQSKGMGGYLISTRWQKNFWLLA